MSLRYERSKFRYALEFPDLFFSQLPICLQHELYGLNQVSFSFFQGRALRVGARQSLSVPDVSLRRFLKYGRQSLFHFGPLLANNCRDA